MIIKKRKDGTKFKQIALQLLAFAAFIYSFHLLLVNYERYEQLKQEHAEQQATAIIYNKTAFEDLYTGEISYKALLKPGLLGKATTNLKEGVITYLTEDEFDTLSVGDSIDGFQIEGVFQRQAYVNEKYRSYYWGFVFLSLYPIGYLLYWLLKIQGLRLFFDRILQMKSVDRALTYLFNFLIFGGLIVGMFFFLFSPGVNMVKNLYGKYNSEGYIDTYALVSDSDYDETIGYKYYEDNYFLALAYKDQEGEPIYLTKEVTRHTYHTYKDADLPIRYSKDNPYKTYTQHTNGKDIWNILLSKTLILYYLAFVIVALLIFTVYLLYKRKKKGYY